MFPHAEPVEVVVAGERLDPYSDGALVADWTAATTHPERCAVAPGGSTEPLESGRNAIDSAFDLIFDHPPNIRRGDRVVVRGLTCEVKGHTIHWRSPFTGWEAGWVVKAEIREG